MKSLASVEVMSEIRGRLRNVRVDDRARWGLIQARAGVASDNFPKYG